MKTLIITGASAGIGLEAARHFLAAGYRVVNLSRRPCPVDAVEHIGCDLSDPTAVTAAGPRLVSLTREAEQTVLVHNAALNRRDSAFAMPSESFREVLEVNLVAPSALNALLIPHMRPGSSILYVGSTLSEKAVPGAFSYVVTKHANVGMMRATCQDLAGRGIHTACICPGFTDTEMLRSHLPPEAMEAIRGMTAYDRLIAPGEIAATLLFCAQNPVINGAVIHANLGQVER